MGIDEPSEFELLLGALQRAADEIGAPSGAAAAAPEADDDLDLVDWLQTGSVLQEAPPSLVDLRALGFDDPLSHQITQPDDIDVDLQPGSTVDQKYEILGLAPRAAGAWEARHVVLRQKFVVQLLARSIVDDPLMWPKFQHDIRTAGMLGHENIEFVTDLGRCDQFGAYLVKQWIDGPTMAEWLRSEGRRSPAEAVAFAHSIGGAVAALHEIGIIHGRLSASTIRRVETEDGAVWKLLDVCIPGGNDVLLAPEQQRGEATGPEADQYAIAYLTWMMLVGPHGGLDDEPNAPTALVDALRTALDDVPLMRWPDIDAMIVELARAVPIAPTPSIHPFDRREASRHVQQALIEDPRIAIPVVDEPVASRTERPRSMLIRVVPRESASAVEAEFSTGARLRREYRRNMLTGGLFVPTATDLTVGSRVRVTLSFTPRELEVPLEALVVTFDSGSADRPRGYGVAFDAPSRQKIEDFVRELDLGLGLSPEDELHVKRALDASANIDPGAAFLLSRLGKSMRLGPAKAMFSGLPYDFDECVASLIEQKFVEVSRSRPEGPARSRPRRSVAVRSAPKLKAVRIDATPAAGTRPPTFSGHEWSDVTRVLETVDYFEEQGNFMAAGRVLESATANAPKVAVFHHRLGLMRARFDMNLTAARSSIRIALELDPGNEEFNGSQRYVATLIEMAAVRIAWERALGSQGSWLRSEPALGRVWFAERGAQNAIYEVDYRAGTAKRSARGSSFRPVAENDPEFDTTERRKPVPIRSGRERHTRQIELARRFPGFGPHFEREPCAEVRTVNSTLSAATTGGLRVFGGGTQLSQASTSQVHDARFSPNEQHIAWVEAQPAGSWTLYVAPITGQGVVRGEYRGRPRFFWSDDSSNLVVLDPKGNELHAVDRRHGTKRLLLAEGCLDLALIRSIDDDSVLVCGRRVVGKSRWFGTWLNAATGEIHGEYLFPAGATEGALRSDGMLAVVLQDGRLLVANLARKVMKPVSTVTPHAASVAGCHWPIGSPLIIAELVGGVARVLSIDVDLLCG